MLGTADRAGSYNHMESFRLDQSQGLICIILDYSQREKDTGVHTLLQVHFWALIMLPLTCFQNQGAICLSGLAILNINPQPSLTKNP